MKKPRAKKLPLFGGKPLRTNRAVTVRIYTRADSTFLEVSVRGQQIGHVRRSAKTREQSTAAEFAGLLVKHLQRQIDIDKPRPATTPPSAVQQTLL